ncbi:MAG: diacylglycerol kinase family protein [Flavobacteriaceae bacterium]|jgi:diacylglycerol kinase (ATP)|nr:diacylglycerol kinase family protein [Flavobacteriaceae bacterium]
MIQKGLEFIVGRLKSIKFALLGAWHLITTEHAFIVHALFSLFLIFLGFFMNLTTQEWLFQIVAIGLVIVTEAFNTVFEKLADFIHPSYHKKIGAIKDLSAGAVFYATLISFIILLVIYLPKFISL